jgi:hypothetical protein
MVDGYFIGGYLMTVYYTGMYLMGVYLMGMYLMSVHLMGVYGRISYTPARFTPGKMHVYEVCRRGCTSGRYMSGRCTSARFSLPVNMYEIYGNFDFRK